MVVREPRSIIDQDDSRHSAELLRFWKSQAVQRAMKDLGMPRVSRDLSPVSASFVRLAKSAIAALRAYEGESSLLGIEGPVIQMAQAAISLGIPVPVEIRTLPYPKGVIPANPFLQERFEGSYTIRFPDGSEEFGKAAHASGTELLIETRESAVVALEQWILLLGENTG